MLHEIIATIFYRFLTSKTNFIIILQGPLLYHFADMPSEMSIELSWADLRETILKFGFQFLVGLISLVFLRELHIFETSLKLEHEFIYIVFVIP